MAKRDSDSDVNILTNILTPLDISKDDGSQTENQQESASSSDKSSTDQSSASTTRNLVVDFTKFREHPLEALKTLSQHVQGSAWRSYENYDGQELYYPGLSDSVLKLTLDNNILKQRVLQLTEIRMQKEQSWLLRESDRVARKAQIESWLWTMAEQMVEEMMCTFDHKTVLRSAYYVVAQIFSRTYHQGVHINTEEVAQLKATAKRLKEKKQSLIFLPCHKSHVDYMSIQFICFRIGISLPVVVSGENLNFAVIGPILRQVGAMYIRRAFGNDKLYSATIQAYIETLLSEGYNFECFVEGTRSRTGKLLPPKFGILKYVLDAVISGRVEDSWILPVSTQYDKVAEAEAYATELLGREKKKETFSDFISARKILSLKMGRVDVRFHEAWSLREYVTDQFNRELARISLNTLTPSSAPLPVTRIDPALVTPEIHTRILRALGYRVLSDINKVSVIMPTSLVGAVLLTLGGRGIGETEIVRRVTWLISSIQRAGGRVGIFGKEGVKDLVDNGIKVLGPDLVGEIDKGVLESTYFAKDPFKLSYYRNQVIHLFVSESIVCVGIHTRLKDGYRSIRRSDLFNRVNFLSHLLSGEFVFGPDGLQTNLAVTLESLVDQRVISIRHNSEDEEDLIELSLSELERGREEFDFYCYLIWPFTDGFWLASVSLFALTPDLEDLSASSNSLQDSDTTPLLWVEEAEFYNAAQRLGKTLYHQGALSYYEAVNKEMLINACKQFLAEGIIVQRRSNTGRSPAIMALHPDWLPHRSVVEPPKSTNAEDEYFNLQIGDIIPSGRLFEFGESISQCRRKGRHRQDTPVLSMHILRMASSIGQSLKTKKVQTLEAVSRPSDDSLVKVSKLKLDNSRL